MKLITTRVKGINDILPNDSVQWQTLEKVASDTARVYGFKEIRVPTFENTELFVRSVGDTTDVVQKEMFTVKGKESTFTLRPEGTAGVVRAVLENGLLNNALPQKLYYLINCFRHEKPQAGRLWEFHQFGCEMFGAASPDADAEVISLAKSVIDRIGLKDIELNINSIGCPHCREEYYKVLRGFLEPKSECLCDTCKSRLEKNPMRILDCKSDICKDIGKDAPLMIDYLCDDCKTHFEGLKSRLNAMGIKYTINPKIVRGLDYYSKTVFEFITTSIGAQGTVCGGGRYDGLIEIMGGKPTAALGFAMGIERLLLTLKAQGSTLGEEKQCDIYIGSMGEKAKMSATVIVNELRADGFWAECDVMDRGVKAQMKYADKIGAAYSMILGDNELADMKAKLKNMKTGEEFEIPIDSSFLDRFANIRIQDMFADGDIADLITT